MPLITGTTKIKLFSNHLMTLCYETAETFNHTLTKSLFILKKIIAKVQSLATNIKINLLMLGYINKFVLLC